MEELKTNVDVQNKICEFCFDNLQNIHESKDLLSYPEDLPDIELALFVTWKFEGMLRGCIGTFKEDLISKILPIYSYLAAFEDSRFPPILPKEIPHLSCSVSFLSDFEPIDDPLDWEVGKHGIEIEFTVDEKNYRGTYLPEVAPEQNWSKEKTLNSLLKKAGYRGGDLESVKDKFNLIRRYQSKKFELTYDEYAKIKESKEEDIFEEIKE